MKRIYFVTEGITDQILLEELVAKWLGDEDFIPNRIQPPTSALAEDMDSPLSQGWRGVVAWCGTALEVVALSRQQVISEADLLVIHIDADVGFDSQFSDPPVVVGAEVDDLCGHVEATIELLLGGLPGNVVICVPSMDLECWIVSSLYPDIADDHRPIEKKLGPAELLIGRSERLVRRKDGRLRKNVPNYQNHKKKFADGWENCVSGLPARCSRAQVFELRVKQRLTV